MTRETFEQHLQMLQCGKFVTCLKNIKEELKGNSPSSTRWMLENNRIVTTFLWESTSSKSVKQKSLMSAEQDTKSLIYQVRSVPVDCICLSLELTVIHNFLLIHCLQVTSHLSDTHVLQRELSTTLHRVLTWFGVDTEAELEELFKTALLKCAEENNDIPVSSVIRLCCAWAVLQMQTMNRQHSFTSLSCCADIGLQDVQDKARYIFEIPLSLSLGLGLEGCEQVVSSSDTVSFLCGLCLCLLPKKRHLSKQYLHNTVNQRWQPYTQYLLAYLDYEEESYLDALMTLGQAYQARADNSVKALHCHLSARCLSKLGKHHCAVEKYREAMELDFEAVQPLYHISLEYRKLGLTDAELESLNLLVTALENKKQDNTTDKRLSVIEEVLHNTRPQVSLVQSLYVLANRCQQLHKLEAASQRYMDLLCCLQDSGKVQVIGDSSISLPSAQQIHHEVIYSLLQSKQYEDCIVICDRLLQCNGEGHFDSTSDSQDDLFVVDEEDKIQQAKKRMLSDSEDTGVTEFTTEDVLTLLYKADALIHCDRSEDAVKCLERAMAPLGSCPILHTGSEQTQDTQRYQKRRRLDSGGTAAVPKEEISYCSNVRKLFADVYCHMGAALARKHNLQDALHFLRLCLQLFPDNATALYNTTLVLWSLGREKEAVAGWTKQYSISTSDSFLINNLLRQRREALRSTDPNSDAGNTFPIMSSAIVMDSVSDKQVLQLDILCFEYLLKRKNSSKW